jgi:hypothetical protein
MLKERVRSYVNLVEDITREMLPVGYRRLRAKPSFNGKRYTSGKS